jgi:hypothetical protein
MDEGETNDNLKIPLLRRRSTPYNIFINKKKESNLNIIFK